MKSGESLSGSVFPIERSTYYKFWLAEKRAIEEHKWYLSEKVGRDVGFEYSQWNWIMAGHRAKWIAKVKISGYYPE